MATKTTKTTKPTTSRRPKCAECGNPLVLAHWDLVDRQWCGKCETETCSQHGRWTAAVPRAPHSPSDAEQDFIDIIQGERDLALPVAELYFHRDVAWRLDFAWLDERIAVAIQGGIWKVSKAGKRYSGSRHLHPTGYVRDCYKYNAAVAQGWRVVYLAEPHLRKPEYVTSLLMDLLSQGLYVHDGAS